MKDALKFGTVTRISGEIATAEVDGSDVDFHRTIFFNLADDRLQVGDLVVLFYRGERVTTVTSLGPCENKERAVLEYADLLQRESHRASSPSDARFFASEARRLAPSLRGD